MPAEVIHEFKIIHIDHHQGKGDSVEFSSSHVFRQGVHDETSVVESREKITSGLFSQTCRCFLQIHRARRHEFLELLLVMGHLCIGAFDCLVLILIDQEKGHGEKEEDHGGDESPKGFTGDDGVQVRDVQVGTGQIDSPAGGALGNRHGTERSPLVRVRLMNGLFRVKGLPEGVGRVLVGVEIPPAPRFRLFFGHRRRREKECSILFYKRVQIDEGCLHGVGGETSPRLEFLLKADAVFIQDTVVEIRRQHVFEALGSQGEFFVRLSERALFLLRIGEEDESRYEDGVDKEEEQKNLS